MFSDPQGQRLGEYVVHEEIGSGGMANVYRATQTTVNRDVALKVIKLEPHAIKSDFAERFDREAKVVATLEHINILPIYDYGVDAGFAYIAMRYLRGGTLNDLIKLEGPLPAEQAADLFTQFASALDYAHERGVVHRDIKPGNILLDEQGNAYLSDFGLAKWIEDRVEITRPDDVLGTMAYISPEQVRGVAIDHRADIYSLGLVLYYMLTGKPPFEDSSKNPASLLNAHLNTIPALPSSLNYAIPQPVDNVVMKALSKEPDQRFASAAEMAEALHQALGRETTARTRRTRQITPGAKGGPDHRALVLAGVGVLAVMLLVVLIPRSQPSLPVAVVQSGQVGTPAEVVPSSLEISQAQQRLGKEGYVAYITCNQTSEYHATQAREIRDFAEDYGLSIRIYDSDSDAYQQSTELERARADGADGFIICLLDPVLLDSALASLDDENLPLVMFNASEARYGGVILIQDEFGLGYAAGAFAGKLIGSELGGTASVIILDYPSLPSIVKRADGIEAGILDEAPLATIMGRYAGGTVEEGRESLNEIIGDSVVFDVIVSINDAGSFGAIEALEDAGFDPGSVSIVSIDAEARAMSLIRSQTFMRGTVPVDREQFSRSAVDLMVKLLAGATVPETIALDPGQVITAENVP